MKVTYLEDLESSRMDVPLLDGRSFRVDIGYVRSPNADEGELVVDSRLIAQDLGIEHRSFMETIRTYEPLIEQEFGVLRFETAKPQLGTKGGRPREYALLTEDQATFLMTLSRNTPEVIRCKINLVKAFSKAKQFLKRREQVAYGTRALLVSAHEVSS